MKKRKKYLVTGGTGFIGSALVRRLIHEGNDVRVLDNNIRGKRDRLEDISHQVEIVEGDITDDRVVENVCTGVDSVCHLASLNGTKFFYTKPELVLEISVKGIVNIIDSCLKKGVSELILASSSEVYQAASIVPTDETVPFSIPDPKNPRYSYAGGKIISELMVIHYGRKYFKRVVIFRPHNVYGPDMGWEHVIPEFIVRMKELCSTKEVSHKKIQFPIEGVGDETRSFINIDDFIEGLMMVIEKGEHLEIYHIGTTEEISIKKLAGLIGNFFNRDIEIISSTRKAGSTLRRCPDITKLKNLGFKPQVSMVDGLYKTIQWYTENAHKNPWLSNEGGIYDRNFKGNF